MIREEQDKAIRILQWLHDNTFLFRLTEEDVKFATEYAINTIKAIPSAEPCKDFATWVANEIFDDEWEYNKDSFAEITCRKLVKLGIVKLTDGEYQLIESEDEKNERSHTRIIN